MTLNITVLAPGQIYQSADYRLFDPTTKQAFDEPSTKAVITAGLAWTGFVTYTGVGRVGSRHTSDFVKEWLAEGPNDSFDEVVNRVRHSAEGWIRRNAPGYAHSFVVAGFVDGVATAALISNFEQGPARTTRSISTEFVVTQFHARRRPEVIVTGLHAAVPRDARRRLARIVDRVRSDPSRIRRELAALTAGAARKHPTLISSDCFVYSQELSGRGHAETFGGARTTMPQALPKPAERAIQSLLNDKFGPSGWSLVGATFARSGEQSPPPDRCSLATIDGAGRPYAVEWLTQPDGRRATPRAVNRDGLVVGDATPTWLGPTYPCAWADGELRWLDHLGGLGGQAVSVSEMSVIGGYSERSDRSSAACLWSAGGALARQLDSSDGRHSAARAVNSRGDVAGWVSVHPTEGGQEHFRPALWFGTAMAVLGRSDSRWGEAVGLKDDGVAVVRLHGSATVEAALWDGDRLQELPRLPAGATSFFPLGSTGAGTVVGMMIFKDGKRHVAVCSVMGAWSSPDGLRRPFEAVAIDTSGNIAGRATVDDYQVPLLWLADDQAVSQLPAVRRHHTAPTYLAEDGIVLGVASADNCAHPIRWVPTWKGGVAAGGFE